MKNIWINLITAKAHPFSWFRLLKTLPHFFVLVFFKQEMKTTSKKIHFVMAVIQRRSTELLICFPVFLSWKALYAGLRSVSILCAAQYTQIYSSNNHCLHMLNDMGYSFNVL